MADRNDTAGAMTGVRFLPLLLAVALICVVLAIALVAFGNRDSEQSGEQARQINELVALSQKIPSQSSAALSGNETAFDALQKSQQRFSKLAESLAGQTQNVPGSTDLLKETQVVLGAREATLAVAEATTDTRALVPQLLQGLGALASSMGPGGVDAMTRHLERFELTGLRLQQDMEALSGGLGDATLVARRLADGIDYMGQVVGGLRGQDSSLGLTAISSANAEAGLKAIVDLHTQLSTNIRTGITSAERIRTARQANAALATSAEQIYSHFESRLGVMTGADTLLGSKALPIGLLVLALAVLGTATTLYARGGNIRKTVELQASKNERNQEAILRLLDELSSLADGDLTVQATVTEDITGAIADSINYAIEALRELVATINDSAITLDAAAKQTQASAGHLAKASVAQSRQIALASESVAAMAASTEEVSGNAERSSDVARHSVDVAHKGGDAVRRTIDGMNAIRETIQETSKRIKRLGESSQEIGNIVELINDIAEQTNILALNASIQASMAGEAGRNRTGVEPDRQPGAEHFREFAPAGVGRPEHCAQHSCAARDQFPDRRKLCRHLQLRREAGRTVGTAAQVGVGLPAARRARQRLGGTGRSAHPDRCAAGHARHAEESQRAGCLSAPAGS